MGPFFVQLARLRVDALIGVVPDILGTEVLQQFTDYRGAFYQKALLSDRPVIETLQYQNTPLPKCRVNEHEDQADCNRRDIESLSCPELNIAQHDWLPLLRCLRQARDNNAKRHVQ